MRKEGKLQKAIRRFSRELRPHSYWRQHLLPLAEEFRAKTEKAKTKKDLEDVITEYLGYEESLDSTSPIVVATATSNSERENRG